MSSSESGSHIVLLVSGSSMLDEIHPLLLLPFDTVDEPVYIDSKSYNGMWGCWAVDNAVQKQNQ